MKLRPNGKYSRIQKFDECGTKVKPLMIIGNEPDEWVWPTCNNCLEIVCSECKCEYENELYCAVCYSRISLLRQGILE